MASACAIASEVDAAESALDSAAFRCALGQFCSGVVIVTARGSEGPAGFTCQSFFSLSLDPPLVAFSPARTSQSYPAIRRSGAFAINILAEDQIELCRRFARSGEDKWRGVRWAPGRTGSPILDGAIAAIDCRIRDEYETGDHYLVVGEVIGLSLAGGNPLLFFDGRFGAFAKGIA